MSRRRLNFLPVLLMAPVLLSLGLILFFFVTSPASASILPLFVLTTTPTQENLWAFADLPKPTYTPAPTLAPTMVPVDPPAAPAIETPASMVMQIVDGEAAPSAQDLQSVPAYTGGKYILVDISEQHMYVYESDALVFSFIASTGIGNSTRVGSFAVQSKIPNAYGSTWNIWMPSWLGIYWSHGLENGIHALPILPGGGILWEGFLGRPVSYGCVVLGTYEAQLLYDWADMGTPVDIQW